MAVQFDVNSFLYDLRCPVGRDPLIKAVSLWPCLHKVNQGVAETQYGKTDNGSCELKGKICVVCRISVVGWAPDHTIRNLAAQVFGHEKDLESLPTHPLVLEEKATEVDLPPYPGVKAVLVHAGGDWNTIIETGSPLVRKVDFKSITQDSSLEEFSLLGYTSGGVAISIQYRQDVSFPKYLLAHGILCTGMGDDFHYQSKMPQELKILFGIVARNNQIPAEQFNQIHAIVERGACDPARAIQRDLYEGHLL